MLEKSEYVSRTYSRNGVLQLRSLF